MKKAISLILAACMLIGLMTGCMGKTGLDGYQEAVSNLSSDGMGFNLNMEISGNSELLSRFVDSGKMNLIVDGAISYKQEVASLSISITIPPAQTAVELTDIIIYGNYMYVNGEKLFTMLNLSDDSVSAPDSLLDGNSYIQIDMNDKGYNIWASEMENEGLLTLGKNMTQIYESVMNDNKAASNEGDTYKLALTDSGMKSLTSGVINDIAKNKETYYDALSETGLLGLFSSGGSKEETMQELDSSLAKFNEDIEANDFAGSTYTASVNKDIVESKFDLLMGESAIIHCSYTGQKSDVSHIQIPVGYIEWSDFETSLGEFQGNSDISTLLPSGGSAGNTDTPGGEGGEGASPPNGGAEEEEKEPVEWKIDNPEFNFNTTQGTENSQLVNGDLSGYTHLKEYTVATVNGENEYVVPLFEGEQHIGPAYVSARTETELSVYVQLISEYGNDFSGYCQNWFENDYSFFGEFGYSACYSDAYLSADSNTMVFALASAHDEAGEEVEVSIYVFQKLSDTNLLSYQINFTPKNLSETDSAIIGEYGRALGHDLTPYITLYETKMGSAG